MQDAFIEVRFRTTEESGRKTPIIGDSYACPMFIDDQAYDWRLLIKGVKMELGSLYEVPVIFLNRDLVLSNLFIGKSVTLWEGKDGADGKIVKVT